MKKNKDNSHIFSLKTERYNDQENKQVNENELSEIGKNIDKIFDEDVENIKFDADRPSHFFVKNTELNDPPEKCVKYDNISDIIVNKYKKIKILFDPTTCGPYICCIVILSKEENEQIEFIYPNIIDIKKNDNFFKVNDKNNLKSITPFNVWYRYEGDWVNDIKMLILERIYLFNEFNSDNTLLYFNNDKTNVFNKEYNIMYGDSGNRYYIISLNYFENCKYKEIIIISQIPYYDFIYTRFIPVAQSLIMNTVKEKKEEDNNEKVEKFDMNIDKRGDYENDIIIDNSGDRINYEKLKNFVDYFNTGKILEYITYEDYYVSLENSIENVNNMKIKNILIFLKAILLERKIVLVSSKKGNTYEKLLLFLSFIPDIINFGFNIKNYEGKFEEWIKFKLPLILFHERYILLLHINNLQLFNEYTFGKNYLISTNTDSDVYKYVKDVVDVLYDIDKDEIFIKNGYLNNALTLTKYEINYLKTISLSFKSFLNFSSAFFENIKKYNNNNNNKNVISSNKDDSNACSQNNAFQYNTNKKNDAPFYENMKNYHVNNKGEPIRDSNQGYVINNQNNIDSNCVKNVNKNVSKYEHNEIYEQYCSPIEYIDDEDDVYVIDIKSLKIQQQNSYNLNIIKEINISNSSINCIKENEENNEFKKQHITELRNNFHKYFDEFFMLSKQNYEEGVKDKRENYNNNYNIHFLEMWNKTSNYNFFIEKDLKLNNFLKISKKNNILLDKEDIENYNFIDDILIIEKKNRKLENENEKIDKTKKEINTNLIDVLLISLKGYVYEGTYCKLKKCKEGIGKLIYNTHCITFYGEWKDDQINGSGHLLYSNKFKYFGKFKNNLFSGNGLYVDYLLNQYEGEFLNGFFNGNGKLIFNKNTYIGIFKDNDLVGKGKIIYENGNIYTGEIKNFLPHGYGFLSYNDTTIFEGIFWEGKKNGNGFLTIKNNPNSDKMLCIEGKWNNDEPVLKKNFHIIFPNKDKYIGKIYILPFGIYKKNNTNCNYLYSKNKIPNNISKQLHDVRNFIETNISNTDKVNNSDQNLISTQSKNITMDKKIENKIFSNGVINIIKSVIHNSDDINSLEIRPDSNPNNTKLKTDAKNSLSDDITNIIQNYSSNNNSCNLEYSENDSTQINFNEKLEIYIKRKEAKLLKKCWEVLDKNWITKIENKLKKNYQIVEYLKEKQIYLIPHKKGLSIMCNNNNSSGSSNDDAKQENYDGMFLLGMKHGYGIFFYDNINRYEGYWYRGMKHGYGILYEGNDIYYAHFNYDKLIKKEKILHEQLCNYKPKKDKLNEEQNYNDFLINQSFFDYKDILFQALSNYL
ncbi:MORN repeat protein, putative [Plasmodium yoelii]|uniref:MORN repeat protein n=3 Tax=Plasmodium yoelii TaxID=5861 RepID=A0AAE9WRA7_PLAYO|nr:MORN repeat protein, putative [Plasmodium yoelii]WBY58496.1 MORN repeat protein [Plasmodium yoelii yoelii]CDU18812.1 conserved Plasmodium protein, unknown function [Plasmodium yoelii]VTZ79397.1 MORN repeat protein, putative [Plasmodium yoelii]|eukprot:XP_022812368.1 MORN repeat protein, putative [Plasmodium yoelii]